jgi:hypothetical protein
MVAEKKTLHRVWGFLLGAALIAVGYIAALVPLVQDPNNSSLEASSGPLLVPAVVGYVTAGAATMSRRTQQVGQGLLVGSTAMSPVAWAGLMAVNLGLIGAQ